MALFTYSLTFEGSQEVPARDTAAFGTGLVIFDTETNSASYVFQVSGLDFGPILGLDPATEQTDDDVTGAHFHNAERGQNGGIVFNILTQDTDDLQIVQVSGNTWTISGVWETTDAASTSIENFATALSSTTIGADVSLYANIHTEEFPGGEVRGQLVGFERQQRDFNDDGNSDILWRNDDGTLGIWLLNGTSVTGVGAGSVDANTEVAGTGDFTGDGLSDILLRNNTGAVFIQQMDGGTVVGTTEIGAADSSWHIEGTGDFNADSVADILWRNDNGAVHIWATDGTTVTVAADVGAADSSWQIQGIGDFGGDGRADILWRNDNGAVHIWQMNGTGVFTAGDVGFADAGWHIEGVGDFGGDGKDDILWRHDNGTVHVWELNGTTLTAATDIGFADSTWHIQDVGDIDGDGDSDIVWRHDNGTVHVWQIEGTAVTATADIGFADTTWEIVPSDGTGPNTAQSTSFGFDDISATEQTDTTAAASSTSGGSSSSLDLVQYGSMLDGAY